MKALEITHREVSRETLLDLADQIPGAWLGIRIAGYLLILAGWKSTQVAELFGLSRNGVVKWIRKANQVGLAAVEDSPRPGRPTPLNDQILGELDQVLSKSPREVGISRTRWDGVVVVEYLKRVHRIDIHVRHAQRLIRKLGYSLRQPIYRFVQASDQGVEEFRKTLKKIRLAIGNKGKRVVLFEDETGFSLHPKLGRVWVKKGTQPYVATRSQHQKRVNVFGWVDPVNGFHGLRQSVKGDTLGFLKCLRRILSRYKGKLIDLWLDNAKWHKGEKVYSFLIEHRQLHLHYLSPYHPELNFQELLWKTMRYEETTNAYFETKEDLSDAISRRSQKWKPDKIISLCKLI